MYLWNVNALVKDLREDKMSENEKLKYYLLSGVFALAVPHELDLFTILDVGVFIIGTYLCFEANSKGDNRNFITRMICLEIPLGIRYVLILLPLFIVVYIIFDKADNINQILNILGIFSMIIYYMFLRSYIAKVSQPELPFPDNNISAN
ncbi:hypothetical protein SRRS_52710 [Sporomusa rhizae]|uniref:hypothetical protein n=1 Tax=Sporomusa rhizae TaxID=357999 RepID=UPI00352B5DF5